MLFYYYCLMHIYVNAEILVLVHHIFASAIIKEQLNPPMVEFLESCK